MKTIKRGETLPQPENCPPEIYHVMKKCWEIEPENRPNMKEIVGILSEISASALDPNTEEEKKIYFQQKKIYEKSQKTIWHQSGEYMNNA